MSTRSIRHSSVGNARGTRQRLQRACQHRSVRNVVSLRPSGFAFVCFALPRLTNANSSPRPPHCRNSGTKRGQVRAAVHRAIVFPQKLKKLGNAQYLINHPGMTFNTTKPAWNRHPHCNTSAGFGCFYTEMRFLFRASKMCLHPSSFCCCFCLPKDCAGNAGGNETPASFPT